MQIRPDELNAAIAKEFCQRGIDAQEQSIGIGQSHAYPRTLEGGVKAAWSRMRF
jgi:hypothetical protein